MSIWQGATLQIWQYGPPTAAERSLAEACDLAQQHGFSGVMVKAFDGIWWMGDPLIDPSPDALGSYTQIEQQRRYVEGRGLGYAIWVNPRYAHPLDQQAAQFAYAGKIAGIVGWDTEPYGDFWGANRPAGAAMNLMEAFAGLAPGVLSVWQPDPRPARLAELRPEEWAPFMSVYQPQVYFTDFGSDPIEEVARGFQQALNFGLEYAPTLPGNATPDDLERAINWLGGQGVTGCVLWRMGSMGPGQLDVIRRTSAPVSQPPVPEPELSLEQRLVALELGLAVTQKETAEDAEQAAARLARIERALDLPRRPVEV